MLTPKGGGPRRCLAVDPVIFWISAAVVIGLLAFTVAATPTARALFTGLQDLIVGQLGWIFTVSISAFLLFSLWLASSAHGGTRLGPDHETPEFSRSAWLAMLFSAGMGIGLLFYGVAEPVLHYGSPPDGGAPSARTAQDALTLSLFHWGLHAWGVYAALGLALAYFHHRRGRPLAIRFVLEPLLGRQTDRLPGKLVDVLAVLGTLFGLATSLGLGARQINAGLAHLFGVEQSVGVQVGLIAGITGCATLSLVSGLQRGIRRLSELNVLLAAGLLLFVLVTGPTLTLLVDLPAQLGRYLTSLPSLSLARPPVDDSDWRKGWTVFYWAWWISWAPFVGTFVARISRGRTVREFVVGVLLLPTAVTLAWFGILGGSALQRELSGAGGLVAAVDENVATAIFVLLEGLPAGGASALLAIVVVTIFFVTSSDSGSFVVDMLTSGGDPDPPVWQRVFWATAEGAIAAALLAAGGLRALQSAAINTGLPFCLVMLAVCVSLLLALRRDRRAAVREEQER